MNCNATPNMMERLGWKTTPGSAKIMGTALGVGGAMWLTFYKGVDIHLWKTNVNLLNGHHHSSHVLYSSNRVMGSIFAIGHVGFWTNVYIHHVVCAMRGPLFVSAFNPLLLDLVAIAGSLVLNESLHLGSVLGAILIIFELYAVLWGKGIEVKKVAQLCPIREPSIRTSDGAIDGESEHSSFEVYDSDSKHSSVRSANGELRRVEIVVT
ncbi:hypothetical protein Hdeb2414_s0009g00316811 [Helianthus debilis subsp. tardiflorus]